MCIRLNAKIKQEGKHIVYNVRRRGTHTHTHTQKNKIRTSTHIGPTSTQGEMLRIEFIKEEDDVMD